MAQTVKTTRRLPLSKLRPYPGNPRRGDVAAIAESLRAHGQYRALVVNADGTVLAGNHTLQALAEIGAKDALCHCVDVSDREAKRIVLIDNRSNDLAGYDEQQLVSLLESLPDLEGTGYTQADLAGLIAANTDADPARDTPAGEPAAKPRTKRGELWLLGEHRLLCGDATKATDVKKLMGGVSLR